MPYCYNCKYLDKEKKKQGKVDGNLYYCQKNKAYINAAKDTCPNFSKSERRSWENDEIYQDSKKYYDNDTPLGFYIFILVVLIILGLILNVFN